MGKKKNIIDNVMLQCTDCKERNYSVRKNKKNSPDRMEISKYCSNERKHTVHKEVK